MKNSNLLVYQYPIRSSGTNFQLAALILVVGLTAVTARANVPPPLNDVRANAITLTNFNNWCSGLAAYTNIQATPDAPVSSCGHPGSGNVWFRFQATTTYIRFNLKTGSQEGSIRYPEIAIWNNDLTPGLCASRPSNEDVSLEKTDLVTGRWYYVSVSDYRANSPGTFTLCANNQTNFDSRSGAITLTQKIDWCSGSGAYSNAGATPDGEPSCGEPLLNNVWFKFQASVPYLKLQVKTGGTEGTMQMPTVTLYNSSNSAVDCQQNQEDVSIEKTDLLVGEWYYISVQSGGPSPTAYEGTFTLCLTEQLSFDYRAGAKELTNKNDWCSGLAAYNNLDANIDDGSGSGCGTRHNDVWFKFQAATTHIKLDVKTGSAEGTIQFPEIALFNAAGGGSIACQEYTAATGDVSLEKSNLVIGQWYYVAVYNGSYNSPPDSQEGTFTLCVTDQLSFDYRASAKDLTQKNNWCSMPAAYSNINAGADGTSTSCGMPYNDVWFKFQASTQYIMLQIKTGEAEGTIKSPEAALWNDNGVSLVCQNSTGVTGDLTLEKFDLSIGQWYYISVYNLNNANDQEGTFTLCINDQLSFDYKAAAVELTQKNNWCSGLAAYNNLNATADGPVSCGNKNNVWFKFQASGTYIKFDVKTGDGEGTIRYPEVILSNDQGVLMCSDNAPSASDVTLEKSGLVIGQWYYLSVYNDNPPWDTNESRGTFTICASDQPTFNHKAGAIELTEKNNWCSASGAYSNVGSTEDENISGCNGSHDNVWFKFKAATNYIKIDLKSKGTFGTVENARFTLVDENNASIACATQVFADGMEEEFFTAEALNLIIDRWYYISVDHSGPENDKGSFTLCITDQIYYNHQAGALEISAPSNWCSGLAAYSNLGATPDGPSASCQGLNQNVWFKFKAKTNSIKLDLKTGLPEGTLRYPVIALWQSNTTLIACKNATAMLEDVALERTDLVVGQWYYVSVYDQQGERGTFTLCADDRCHEPPSSFNVTISSTCYGQSTGSLILTNSQTGVTYFLNEAEQKAGTGQPLTWKNLLAQNYKITAQRGVCGLETIATQQVSAYPSIETYPIVKLSGETCGSDSIRMNGSQVGVSYQLRRDNTNIGNLIPGTNAAISWSGLMLSGNYTIIAQNGLGSCVKTLPQTIMIDCNYNDLRISQRLSIASSKTVPSNYVLAVGGKVITAGLNLKVPDQWPDYVFTNDHSLMPLGEVQRFIEDNGHLPNIPSAKEMEAKGDYSIAAMDVRLLEKVEELTLYIIQLNENVNHVASLKHFANSRRVKLLSGDVVPSFLNHKPNADAAVRESAISDASGVQDKIIKSRQEGPATGPLLENAVVNHTLAIGTSRVPEGYNLAVKGNIIARGINLNVPAQWPDYVFESNYKLPDLRQLETYIRANGHLPNLPSAKEMAQLGKYNLSEMDSKMLEKIEELMLYIIQLKDKTGGDQNPLFVMNENKFQAEEISSQAPVSHAESSEDVSRENPAATVASPVLFEDIAIRQTLTIASSRAPEKYKLAVGEDIIATGMDILIPQKWPDYVFDLSYPLMPLEAVKDHIVLYGHLPGFKPAREMYNDKDYDVAEIDMKLLEKIEELTLYVIALEKKTGARQRFLPRVPSTKKE